jgi:hypothetical protein
VSATRVSFVSRLVIGQAYQRRTRAKVKPVVRLAQIHRVDRTVEVLADDGRHEIPMTELRDRYRLLERTR